MPPASLFYVCLFLAQCAVDGLLVGLGGRSSSSSRSTLVPYLHQPPKLPVWPVAIGVVATVAELVGQHKISQNILQTVGGRVVPVSLSELDVSPFLLLAHHSHSFTPFDPGTAFQNPVTASQNPSSSFSEKPAMQRVL
jgi:hypothetical protein